MTIASTPPWGIDTMARMDNGKSPGYSFSKEQLLTRLRRIRGRSGISGRSLTPLGTACRLHC